MKDKIGVLAEVEVNDLVYQLSRTLSDEALVEFVKDLDRQAADYDFTRKLRNYFVEEMKKEDKVD